MGTDERTDFEERTSIVPLDVEHHRNIFASRIHAAPAGWLRCDFDLLHPRAHLEKELLQITAHCFFLSKTGYAAECVDPAERNRWSCFALVRSLQGLNVSFSFPPQ